MKTSNSLRLLIIDDDTFLADIIRDIAEDAGYDVSCIHNGKYVVSEISVFRPDVIFLDLVLPGFDGVEIINLLGEIHCKAKLVLMSGVDRRTLTSVSNSATDAGLELLSTISKPITAEAVSAILQPLSANRTVNGGDNQDRSNLTWGPQLILTPHLWLNRPTNLAVDPHAIDLHWKTDDEAFYPMSEMLAPTLVNKSRYGLVSLLCAKLNEFNQVAPDTNTVTDPSLSLQQELFQDLNLPNALEAISSQSNLAMAQITLEIPEEVFISTEKATQNNIARLKLKGFRLAVCIEKAVEQVLPKLSRMAIDDLVLDMSYALNHPHKLEDPESEYQFSSMIATTSKSGMTIWAKNVDTQQQLDFARQCNFSAIRGMAFQPPGDIRELQHAAIPG